MGTVFIAFGATVATFAYLSDLFTNQTAEGFYMLSTLSIVLGLICLTSPKRYT